MGECSKDPWLRRPGRAREGFPAPAALSCRRKELVLTFSNLRLLPRQPGPRIAALVIVAALLALLAYVDTDFAIAVGIFLAGLQVVIALIQLMGNDVDDPNEPPVESEQLHG